MNNQREKLVLLTILIISLGIFYTYQWQIKPLKTQLRRLKQTNIIAPTQAPNLIARPEKTNNFYQINSQALSHAHINRYQLSKQQLKADCDVKQLLMYLNKLKSSDYSYSIKRLKLIANPTHTQLITTIGFKHV